MEIKLRIARSQLGTALDLFIRDKDPLSVRALACGGCEVIEGLAEHLGQPIFSSHILETHPNIDIAKIMALRNKYWNAIKHFYNRNNKDARDDETLMTNFSDAANDVMQFIGWLDYMTVTKKLPVAVHVFQVWWYATNPEKMNPDVDASPFNQLFPSITNCDRAEKKRRLRRTIEKYRDNAAILADPRTELLPLTISAVSTSWA